MNWREWINVSIIMHSQFRIDGYDDHCGHIHSDIDVNECIQWWSAISFPSKHHTQVERECLVHLFIHTWLMVGMRGWRGCERNGDVFGGLSEDDEWMRCTWQENDMRGWDGQTCCYSSFLDETSGWQMGKEDVGDSKGIDGCKDGGRGGKGGKEDGCGMVMMIDGLTWVDWRDGYLMMMYTLWMDGWWKEWEEGGWC